MSYGIGRLTEDTDQVAEALASLQKQVVGGEKPKGRQLTCSDCGQSGYEGEYPFSTDPGSGQCDDCI